jgi:hypothetical protein
MEEAQERTGPGLRVGGQEGSGGVRTVIVFLDLPVHFEFRAGSMPLLPEGTEIVFDPMELKSAKHPGKTRTVSGSYLVERRVLRYGSRPGLSGLTQFLEMKPPA